MVNALNTLCFVKNGIKSDVGLAIQRTMAERCQKLDFKRRNHLFYGVTKITYFGDKCSYSEKGYNSSHRCKWTIGVGFVISGGNGLPVRGGAIPGSKNDTLTMENLLVALKAWGYQSIPMIVDRGMLSAQNINNLVQQEEFIDGRFLMFCTDQRISAKNVFTIYFQRDEIEKAFKSLKGELSLGPIRYQRPERIDAYLTIVFLAYLLRTIVKFRLKKAGIDMSVDQAVDELKNLTLVEFSYKGRVRWKLS